MTEIPETQDHKDLREIMLREDKEEREILDLQDLQDQKDTMQ